MTEVDPDALRMLALGRGDLAAFDALFERWNARLLRFLERMVRDSATAEELLQETFLRVYRARESYVASSRFSTWLYRIATNVALNELRRPSRARSHASTEDGEARVELIEGGSAPDVAAHARLEAAVLARQLGQLPERQRIALWLTAVEGHSYAEVAEILETKPTSVKSLVHRARASLADRMQREAAPGIDEETEPAKRHRR